MVDRVRITEHDVSSALPVGDVGMSMPTPDDQRSYLCFKLGDDDLPGIIFTLRPIILLCLAAQVFEALSALDLPDEKLGAATKILRGQLREARRDRAEQLRRIAAVFNQAENDGCVGEKP